MNEKKKCDHYNQCIDILAGVSLTRLAIISGQEGDVYHALKKSAPGFNGFGEAYFSIVAYDIIKGWKRHQQMTLNLVVPVGKIQFFAYDNREDSASIGTSASIILGIENYQRLTIPPGIWMAFRGLSKNLNMLLNIADIEHNKNEEDSIDPELADFPSLPRYHYLGEKK